MKYIHSVSLNIIVESTSEIPSKEELLARFKERLLEDSTIEFEIFDSEVAGEN